MISTKNLDKILRSKQLLDICQGIAVLEAIIMPEWQFRYYSLNCRWSQNVQVASMRNGSGNHYFIYFNEFGAIIKGFDHESPMTPFRLQPPQLWGGLIDNVPDQFSEFLEDPAFSINETTFCIWYTHSKNRWEIGNIEFPGGIDDPDGSKDLLFILDGKPKTYYEWAQDYYEKAIPFKTVVEIYNKEPLTKELIYSLNPTLDVMIIKSDLVDISYPLSYDLILELGLRKREYRGRGGLIGGDGPN